MVESGESGSKNVFTLLFMSIIKVCVSPDLVLVLESKLTEFSVKLFEVDLSNILRILKEVSDFCVALVLPDEEGSTLHPVIHLVQK